MIYGDAVAMDGGEILLTKAIDGGEVGMLSSMDGGEIGSFTPVITGDYEQLDNKPSINGVTLEGDLSTEDLHIQAGVTSWNGQTGDVVYTPPAAPVQSVNGRTGAVVVNEALEPLTGSTINVTPSQVSSALAEGRDVAISHVDNSFGILVFSAFNETTSAGVVVSNTLIYTYGVMYAYQLIGWKSADEWETRADVLVLPRDIPTNVSSFNNDAGYLTANTGVTSVNGNSGAVTVSVPTKTSDLTNDSGFINSAQAASAAPVQSVNGQTGAVSLLIPAVPTTVSSFTNDAGYVNASGAASAAPVQSVNGQTGAVSLSIPTVPTNVSSFTNDAGYLTLADLPIYNGGVQ